MKCLNCGKELLKSAKKYCCMECQTAYIEKRKIEEIDKKGEFPKMGKFLETDRRVARRWLIAKGFDRCSICGLKEWNGKPLLLIVDHIDGNPNNSKIENVRFLCPNCDSQQSTYKNRCREHFNEGENSRSSRRKESYDKRLERLGFKRTVREREKAICPICKSEFVKPRKSAKYCSKHCLHVANHNNPSGFCVH